MISFPFPYTQILFYKSPNTGEIKLLTFCVKNKRSVHYEQQLKRGSGGKKNPDASLRSGVGCGKEGSPSPELSSAFLDEEIYEGWEQVQKVYSLSCSFQNGF
jgi:hypothetical protein